MYIFWHKSTSETGKALAAALKIPGGSTPPAKSEDVLIRWGSSEQIPKNPRRVINSRAAIALATDKILSSEKFREYGIATPEIVLAKDAESLRFPPAYLGRTRNHSQGKDIILCMQSMDIKRAIKEGSEYFSQFIPTRREYRIHVFGHRAVKISQKVLKNGEEWTPFVRNHENGYIFVEPKVAPKVAHTEQAIRAVASLGLDFGAVDLIVSDDYHPYVLEVNTGPSLADNGLDVYTHELKAMISSAPQQRFN